MPTIRFLPSGTSGSVQEGTGLLEAAKQVGVDIEAPCGAKGTCGKCVVRVAEGTLNSAEDSTLSSEAVKEGYIQACKATVGSNNATLEIPPPIDNQGQFADSDPDIQRIAVDRFPKAWEMHSGIFCHNLSIALSGLEFPKSDHERLVSTLQDYFPAQKIDIPLAVLHCMSTRIREDEGRISVLAYGQPGSVRVLDIQSGHQQTGIYGVAIDLGTTSISIRLAALSGSETTIIKSGYNQQLSCGADIISRINYAKRPSRLEELRQKVTDSINSLLSEALDELKLEYKQVLSAVVSGNTTMIHLLLGISPEYIRLEPYTPAALSFPEFTAKELKLTIHPLAPIHISPAVGSYVGGDITAGLLCTDLTDREDSISMFLDIGTNGELAIGNQDFILACACSAGPAFEGGGLQFGMRAAKGAIESISVDPESGKAGVEIIQDAKARGICGSGIISLLAQLFKTRWLDPSGKLSRSKSSPYIEFEGRQARYIIVTAEESAEGEPITISETEIENVIRAKAAIYSACRLLLDQLGIDFDAVDRFYIAGGFGRYLDLEDSIAVGLLPDLKRSTFEFLGNTSLIGSTMLLHSKEFRLKQQELAKRITYIDLSTDPAYMEQYTAALFLPHTDGSLFPSV